MIGGLPLLQRCMRNRPIMILCAVTGTAQTFAFAVLAWPGLWDGLHLPHWRVWMPYLTQIGGSSATPSPSPSPSCCSPPALPCPVLSCPVLSCPVYLLVCLSASVAALSTQ
jgi:hypothetical protein